MGILAESLGLPGEFLVGICGLRELSSLPALSGAPLGLKGQVFHKSLKAPGRLKIRATKIIELVAPRPRAWPGTLEGVSSYI